MRDEAILAKQIRIALERDGRVRVVPNFVGMVVPYALVQRALRANDLELLRHMRPINAGLGVGSADLVGILKGGRAFACEVKTATGSVRPEQPLWLASVRRWGGFATVVRSPEDAIAAVNRAVAGASE